MRLIIEGDPKEIAALVLAAQERRESDGIDVNHFAECLHAALQNARLNTWEELACAKL